MRTSKSPLKRRLNKFEKITLFIGTICLCFNFGVSCYSLITRSSIKINETLIFPIIVIIFSILTLIYLYRGIFEERSYELMIYTISTASLTFFIIINFVHEFDKNNLKLIYIVRLGVTVLILPVTSIIASLLAFNYNIRGNIIFNTVGDRENLQENCKNLFVFEALLQLDLQFLLCVVVMSIVQLEKYHVIILTVGVIFAIVWTILGFFSMRFEKKLGSYSFLFLGLVEPLFIIYLIYNTTINIINANRLPIESPVVQVASITFTCVLVTLFIHIALLAMGTYVQTNFGQGLKNKVILRSNYVVQEDGEGNSLISS